MAAAVVGDGKMNVTVIIASRETLRTAEPKWGIVRDRREQHRGWNEESKREREREEESEGERGRGCVCANYGRFFLAPQLFPADERRGR
jgi:hypothetical protein